MTEQPLIPSTLYTQGSKEVQQEVVDDLKIPDPSPEAAQAAIEENRVEGDTCPSKCPCSCRKG